MPEPTLALSLGGTKHMHEIGMSHFEALAKKAGISTNLVRQTVEEAVQQFQQAWATHHSNLPMTEQVRQVIETHFSKVPLFAKNVV
jgi:EAL domain-containing protein (putative c-di-GMP-specific phosphodiesterase class I)